MGPYGLNPYSISLNAVSVNQKKIHLVVLTYFLTKTIQQICQLFMFNGYLSDCDVITPTTYIFFFF